METLQMEGRRAHAVAHLAYARSQKSGTGILGSKRVLQGGEKSSPLSVLRDLWLVYGVYGLGGEKWKCGPRSESVVQVKHWWREVWSREQNRALGQTLPRLSVVRGEKLRLWVKRWWREVWSRERNYGLGSNLGGGKCGPWEQNRALGQTLPRPSVVRGSKTVPRVKLCPA